ncbi:ABC transporter substrate-binding protein [Rhodopseudomonas pseudopalustris]|uniref:Amino acid/amide ABC transporter substrate-binding protein, HAAT family n=1 Tax=Rhodopseudomonas pseudopalustris TaxID=1513892 RepID=A0A1H8NTS8_9BRAD|nr:amino acid/amide ABC transporter substrate-binding protein, HAAT family [Rhodopseudomonas pseudopalustris]
MMGTYRMAVIGRLTTVALWAGLGVASLGVTSLGVAGLGIGGAAAQQSADTSPVRIGVLTDMSGLFADISGHGAVIAVKMAVDDFGGKVLGRPIEVLSADHQNKADVGLSLARAWIDEKNVVMLADLMNSSVALGVMELTRNKDRIAIVNGASTSVITNEKCTPNSIHYTWDTYALARGTANAVVNRGKKKWALLEADFAYGHQLANDSRRFVEAAGGAVVSEIKHPINTSDFSSFLLQAQSSGADVIALANGGADTINSIKSAAEFGIGRGGKQQVVGLAINLNDTKALGLDAAQGLLLTEAFYWDRNDETRAWSKRFQEKFGKMPTSTQAGDYSSTMHYLKAVAAAGTLDAQTVMAKMRDTPVDDFFAKGGKIRIDGRMVHDMYLAEVKKPSESKGPWDFYNILATIPGDQAFRPLSESACPLVKK